MEGRAHTHLGQGPLVSREAVAQSSFVNAQSRGSPAPAADPPTGLVSLQQQQQQTQCFRDGCTRLLPVMR